MMKKKQVRKSILKKRERKLDTIAYGKLDIMWFFQWLKLAVDMEGQSLDFGKLSNWSDGDTTTRKGRYDEKEKVVTISKRVLKSNKKKIVLGGIGLSAINLNELKRLPKIMSMTKREIFQHFNKWFVKNKHLFEDYTVQFVEDKNKMIDSDDYFTVQIPKSIDRRKIDNQIDLLMTGLKLKTPGGKKREITFIRGVQKDVMQKQWDVFKYKTTTGWMKNKTDENNQRIAQKVGYTEKFNSLNAYDNKQIKGVRAVQKSYASAKCIIINVGKGMFPKSTL
jgi:hypothetical protein